MFNFFKKGAKKTEPDLAAMKESFLYAMRESVQHVQAINDKTRELFIEFVKNQQIQNMPRINGTDQGKVIHAGGKGGADFSIRYRNDTARGNNAGIHRLEWIAQPSAINPETEEEWDDTLWQPVAGGDAVEYTYEP
jgi:hypothetical protein